MAVPQRSIRRPAIRQNRFFWCASCFLGSSPSSRPDRLSLQESGSHDLHRRRTLPPHRQAGRRHGDAGARGRQSLSDRAARLRRGLGPADRRSAADDAVRPAARPRLLGDQGAGRARGQRPAYRATTDRDRRQLRQHRGLQRSDEQQLQRPFHGPAMGRHGQRRRVGGGGQGDGGLAARPARTRSSGSG